MSCSAAPRVDLGGWRSHNRRHPGIVLARSPSDAGAPPLARVRAAALCPLECCRVRGAVRQAFRGVRPAARPGALSEAMSPRRCARSARAARRGRGAAGGARLHRQGARTRDRGGGAGLGHPRPQVVKIVNDVMVEALGGEGAVPLNLYAPAPIPILMVGLQGSGKTTTVGQARLRLRERLRRRVLLASLDTQRPAAQLQLAQLAEQARCPACRSSPARRRCRSPSAPWTPGGARATTSSSSTPPGARDRRGADGGGAPRSAPTPSRPRPCWWPMR